MSFTCKFEELDDTTRDYLLDAKTRKGKGMPGVFVSVGNSKPIWALLLGPILGGGLFFYSFGSTKDAWAIAMLQTAGLLIGGWFVLYAFRRWTASRSKVYGGYFQFFDPLFVYDVKGEEVTIIDLETVKGVTAIPAENGGRVDFDLGYDQYASIIVPNQYFASLVEEYYGAMAQLEQQEDGKWASGTVAELGAAAKYVVEHEEFPANTEVLELDVPNIPREPAKDGKAGWGAFPILLGLGATVGLFLLLWMANVPMQDEIAFNNAKNEGATGLRGYLLDQRNTRHRDEVKELLGKLYDAPINKINGAAVPPNRKESREGMVKILDALRSTEVPVVSLDVQRIGEPDNRRSLIRQQLADALGQSLGTQLISFAEPIGGVKPHILIKYTDVMNGNSVGVDIEFRLDPDVEEPVQKSSFVLKLPEATVTGGADVVAYGLALELVGEYRATPIFVPDFE